jgi:GWxTD domain-containing protein
MAGSYSNNNTIMKPSFTLLHNSDTASRVLYKFNNDELLYQRKEGDEKFTAKVRVKYTLMTSYEITTVRDTGSVLIEDAATEDEKKVILGYFDFPAYTGTSYLIKVDATDLNRAQTFTHYIDIDKSNRFNRQNFLVTDTSNVPLFRNYLRMGETIRIKCTTPNTKNLMCSHYNRNFPLPPPPFSMYQPRPFEYQPDSIFQLILDETGTVEITLPSKGFYHIQSDTVPQGKRGYTLFYYDTYFPKVHSAYQMYTPLRFISSKKEFQTILSEKNKKKAVDDFWLKCSSNEDRARELIKHYYGRVHQANMYFTSYVQGWKTDRGMVYLIFGSPGVIYRTSDSEKWVYGQENNYMSLSFTFLKVENPFTNNDFSLSRSQTYKSSWYRAVDTWRQGRVYSIK